MILLSIKRKEKVFLVVHWDGESSFWLLVRWPFVRSSFSVTIPILLIPLPVPLARLSIESSSHKKDRGVPEPITSSKFLLKGFPCSRPSRPLLGEPTLKPPAGQALISEFIAGKHPSVPEGRNLGELPHS